MKVLWSAIGITEARGKMNGQVASRNRSSAYMRTKVTPVNPSTPFQSAVRTLFTTYSTAWRTLTQAQRDAWNFAVENFLATNIFGNSVRPTGKNLYTLLNINLTNVGMATISVPPLPAQIVGFTLFTISADFSNPDIITTFAPTPLASPTRLLLEATTGLSAGVGFVKSEYRKIGFRAPGFASGANIIADYTAKFGALIVGTKIFVRITPVNEVTGQKGVSFSASTIVVA